MSLEFNLEILSDLDSNIMFDTLGSVSELNLKKLDSCLEGDGIIIFILDEEPLFDSVIEDAFGFQPNLSILFRINPIEALERGERSIISITNYLLENFSRNAVLLFNGENLILQSLNGDLILNDEWDWTEVLLDEIKIPNKIQNISSPLLE